LIERPSFASADGFKVINTLAVPYALDDPFMLALMRD
jgi:hypothetical protein